MTSVTCAAVSGAMYIDDQPEVVVKMVLTGVGSVMFSNSNASKLAASFANRIAYSERSVASETTCTSTSRTMAPTAAFRDGTDTCTVLAGSTSLTGRKSVSTRYSPVQAGCTVSSRIASAAFSQSTEVGASGSLSRRT